jgi:hypothetical protein
MISVGAATKGTLGWLAAKYYASDEFTSLDPQSQNTRRRVIDSCLSEPHTDDDPDPLRNCPLNGRACNNRSHQRSNA